MSIRILRPGLLTTVQDHGRHGFQRVGLCPGGAMDKVSLALANALVGNPPDEAAAGNRSPRRHSGNILSPGPISTASLTGAQYWPDDRP